MAAWLGRMKEELWSGTAGVEKLRSGTAEVKKQRLGTAEVKELWSGTAGGGESPSTMTTATMLL